MIHFTGEPRLLHELPHSSPARSIASLAPYRLKRVLSVPHAVWVVRAAVPLRLAFFATDSLADRCRRGPAPLGCAVARYRSQLAAIFYTACSSVHELVDQIFD